MRLAALLCTLAVVGLALAPATPARAALTSRYVFGISDGPAFTPQLRLTNLDGDQTLDYSDRGWYSNAGLHDPLNENYAAGRTNRDTGGAGTLYRNWFAFDIPAITSGEFTGAVLLLPLPDTSGGDPYGGYYSGLSSEAYELFDVTTPLVDLFSGLAALGAYIDLGNGQRFGSVMVSDSDEGTTVAIPLNSEALASINAAAGQGWALGGALQVPEPASAVLAGMGLATLAALGRRRVVRRG